MKLHQSVFFALNADFSYKDNVLQLPIFSGLHLKLFLLITALCVSGCTTAEPPVQPDVIPLRIHAGFNLNQGTTDQPLAQVVKIYHLRALKRFEQTPFNSFLDEEKERKALGSDLVDSREMLLTPGQHYEAEEVLEDGTQYIGIVAFFRQPAAQRWRFVYDGKASVPTGITVGIHACALTSTQGELLSTVSGSASSLATVRCGGKP